MSTRVLPPNGNKLQQGTSVSSATLALFFTIIHDEPSPLLYMKQVLEMLPMILIGIAAAGVGY